MAEIDLVSSHTPWAPLPRMVPWSDLGDGSVYDPMPGQQPTADEVWSKQSQVRRAYADSVAYSFDALTSWLERTDDDNLVLLVLGDHQPSAVVSGEGASHDVPVTLISRDRSIVRAVAGWNWQPGLVPDAHAPVWPMSAFRDRFLTTFSTGAAARVRTP